MCLKRETQRTSGGAGGRGSPATCQPPPVLVPSTPEPGPVLVGIISSLARAFCACGTDGHRNHVATDSKISQYSTFNRESLPADIVSGPVGSSDNAATPDFVWSTSTFSALPHHGMPDRMVFPWQHVEF